MNASTAVGRYLRSTHAPDGVICVEMDDPTGSANKTNDLFKYELDALLTRIEAGPAPRGVMFLSAKRSFGVGGDIAQVMTFARRGEAASIEDSERIKALFRRIERLACPTVAIIEGTAAGGGWELALACHARFVLDDPAIRLGFPEVDFGLVPGAGGMVRLVHLLGAARAARLITSAAMQGPQAALSEGLVTALGSDRAELMRLALSWIGGNPAPAQPWDRPGHGAPNRALPGEPAGGAPASDAPRLALEAIAEIASLPFDGGAMVESRCFARCAVSAQARALIGLGFYDRNALRRKAAPIPALSRDEPFARAMRIALQNEIAMLEGEGAPRAAIEASLTAAGYARSGASHPAIGGNIVVGDPLLERRLMFAQATAALRALEGAGFCAAAANVASVEAGDFPRRTGGVLRFVESYGLHRFVSTARDLQSVCGLRFALPFANAVDLSSCLAAARHRDTEQGTHP